MSKESGQNSPAASIPAYTRYVSYQDSLAAEQRIYENCIDVHGLPPIFHYWSNRHLLPKLQPFGFTSPNDMIAQGLQKIAHAASHSPRFVSLGAGNCDLEIDLARTLRSNGYDFILDCFDLNSSMLERGRLAAEHAGLSSHLNFIPADLNTWQADHEYDAVVASQSLHHVINLEGLFDQVQRSLRPGGTFLISDMIGRNGHQRWPEALSIVHEFWRKLPPSYRFNQLVGYYEELYQSWDCSVEGFEGVRSQDILPLLLERFHFHLFVSYGNVIDPFIDRAFGPHFDPASEWDRAFIDAVHARDERELASGNLTPTHMIAAVSNEPSAVPKPFHCVRSPDKVAPAPAPLPAYDWNSWPQDRQKELEIACRHLSETGHEIKQRTQWALGLAAQLEDRTHWALRLEKDQQSLTAHASQLQQEFEERTVWALALQAELEKQTVLALALQQRVAAVEQEMEQRTLWALRSQHELKEQTSRAERLDRELYQLLHNPWHLAKRLLGAIRNRVRFKT